VGGLKALLENQLSEEELTQCLRQLVDLEVVQLQPSSRFAGESEYRFRQLAVRDAAYSLVPDSLRPTWQRQASAWVDGAGTGTRAR